MKSNHYTHSLYYKLLIGYLIFGLLGFITIATISSEMTYHHLVERESEVLYDEATMIADRCSKAYEGKTINLDSVNILNVYNYEDTRNCRCSGG